MELMVNETSLTLQKVTMNAHNHNNPLKKWEDSCTNVFLMSK
jgi:hypothetical protein